MNSDGIKDQSQILTKLIDSFISDAKDKEGQNIVEEQRIVLKKKELIKTEKELEGYEGRIQAEKRYLDKFGIELKEREIEIEKQLKHIKDQEALLIDIDKRKQEIKKEEERLAIKLAKEKEIDEKLAEINDKLEVIAREKKIDELRKQSIDEEKKVIIIEKNRLQRVARSLDVK